MVFGIGRGVRPSRRLVRAVSGAAALFEPHFGWRILWFFGAPTGLVLILCNNLIPESPRFLLARGRVDEVANSLSATPCGWDPRDRIDAGALRTYWRYR